jgi:type II secretion system protein N
VVKQRLVSEAASAGWTVTFRSMGPGLFGVTAREVRVVRASSPAAAPRAAAETGQEPQAPEPLVISSIAARPALFPPGVAIRASALGGHISGAVGGLGDLSISLSLDDLDPAQGNLKGFTGLDLSGKIHGELSLVVPRSQLPGSKSQDYDLGAASGSLGVNTEKLLIKGGTLVLPLYGQPTPVDLPRIGLGDLDGKIKIEKGMATVDHLHGKSEDLELSVSGTVKLNRRPDYSELNMDLKLKAEPEFTKRLGMIGSGLSILPSDRENPAFRIAKVNGYLGQPNFGPGVSR